MLLARLALAVCGSRINTALPPSEPRIGCANSQVRRVLAKPVQSAPQYAIKEQRFNILGDVDHGEGVSGGVVLLIFGRADLRYPQRLCLSDQNGKQF